MPITTPQSITVPLTDLPSPPYVALEVIRLANDQDSSASDLAKVLNGDPVLATRVLKMANSPAYGMSREIISVERATALLGLKAIKMMALSFSLAGEMASDAGALSIDAFWYHSLFNAVTARRWAEFLAPGLADEAFLSGLVSHLGRLVLAQQHKAAYAEMLVKCETSWPTFDDERDTFGFTSADVTAILLDSWGLPRIIVEAAGSMYRDGNPDPEVNGACELSAVLASVRITEGALEEGADTDAVTQLYESVVAAGFAPEEADTFVAELERRITHTAETLAVKLPSGMSPSDMLTKARTRLVEVSLEAAHNLQDVEARAEELQRANVELEGLAYEDRLTGVANRAALDQHLERVIAGAVRAGESASVGVIIFDIDHFKRCNDVHGHQVGDDTLRRVAQAMNRVTRAEELFARYGGEEFVLVAVDCTMEDLSYTAERLRREVETLRLNTKVEPLKVTVSGGAALTRCVRHESEGARLLAAADQALYAAKAAGRNQICLAEDI